MANPTSTNPMMTQRSAALVDTPSPPLVAPSDSPVTGLTGPATSSSGVAVEGGNVGNVVELDAAAWPDTVGRFVVARPAAVVVGARVDAGSACVGRGRDRVVVGSSAVVSGAVAVERGRVVRNWDGRALAARSPGARARTASSTGI